VCNKLAGSALLTDPERVKAIIDAVVQAVPVPVTLKIRTGPAPSNRNGVQIAMLAEQAGISALSVHGRTRADRFKGRAEYETMRDICQSVDIPVFANGDITTPLEAKNVLKFTGADGVMIGRAAQGNPWIFREIRHYLDSGELLPPPSAEEVEAVMKRHIAQLHSAYGELQGVRVARKHISWYLSGRQGSKPYRDQLMRCEHPSDQFELLTACFQSLGRQQHKHSPLITEPEQQAA
jgi:tRNA-dihydrouridine synthase B